MTVILDIDQWQKEIIDSPARIKTCMGGRGVGKTLCGRNLLIKCGLTCGRGEFAYFSPSYSIAKRECRAIARHKILKPRIECSGDQPFPFIEWRSGAKTYFRSLDREETVLGFHLNGAVVDEVHKVGERAIDEIVRPQVGAKRGWLLLIGQHDEDGEDGWISKRFFNPGQLPNDKIQSWRIPSSMGRMYQGENGRAELEFIKSTTNNYEWRWQYLAEAVESQNKAFRSCDVEKCIRGDVQSESLGTQCIIGYDLGKVTDPSAQVVLGVIDKDRCRVLDATLHRLGEPHEQQALALERLVRVYGNPICVVDVTGGGAGAVRPGQDVDAYVKFYRDHIPTMRGFNINQHTKQQIVQAVQLMIEQGRISIPSGCTDLIRQLKAYRWERRSSGTLDYHGPNGHDDDLVMALCLATTAFTRKWYGGQGGKPLEAML